MKNMKQGVILAGSSLSFALLTACAGSSKSEIETVTLEELAKNKRQAIEEIRKLDYDNLHIVRDFDFEVPTEIGKYRVICKDPFQDKWDTLAAEYIPEDIYDESKVVIDKNYEPYGPTFRDEESGRYLFTAGNGTFVYESKRSGLVNSVISGSDNDGEEKYYYLNGAYDNDIYTLNGEEVSIAEAVKTAEEFVDRFIQVSDFPQDFVPVVAVAKQDENKNAAIKVEFGNVYKGLPLCIVQSCLGDLSFELLGAPAGITGADEKDSIGFFAEQYAFEDYETLETYTSIVTPKRAVETLQASLAERTEYDVIGMELIYCPVRCHDIEAEQLDTEEAEELTIGWVSEKDILELTPYWAIYIDMTWAREIYGLVNCVTGELEFVNNQR